MSKRSIQTSSGNLDQSPTKFFRVGKLAAEVSQPMWLQRNPCCTGEWTSSGLSAFWWWCRWVAAHHKGPRWTAEFPRMAKRRVQPREALKGIVGKIAVVERGDGEHPDQIQSRRRPDCRPAPPDPDDSEAHAVQDDERNDPQPVHAG